jgi:hypothetical protein
MRPDSNKLTEEAHEACHSLLIKPEDLHHKGLDYFIKENGNPISVEIAEVRFKHF